MKWDAPTSSETLNRLLKAVYEKTGSSWVIQERCVYVRRFFIADKVVREFELYRDNALVTFYTVPNSRAHSSELIAAYLYGVLIGVNSFEYLP